MKESLIGGSGAKGYELSVRWIRAGCNDVQTGQLRFWADENAKAFVAIVLRRAAKGPVGVLPRSVAYS